MESDAAENQFHLKTILSFLYLSHLGRRFHKEPGKTSLRIAFATVSFCGFVLVTLYRSQIGACLAIKIFRPPIENIEEVPQSPYRLLIVNGTSIHDMFKVAEKTDDIRHQIMNDNKIKLVKTSNEGVRMLEEGKMSLLVN